MDRKCFGCPGALGRLPGSPGLSLRCGFLECSLGLLWNDRGRISLLWELPVPGCVPDVILGRLLASQHPPPPSPSSVAFLAWPAMRHFECVSLEGRVCLVNCTDGVLSLGVACVVASLLGHPWCCPVSSGVGPGCLLFSSLENEDESFCPGQRKGTYQDAVVINQFGQGLLFPGAQSPCPLSSMNSAVQQASGQWVGDTEAFLAFTYKPLSEHCRPQGSPRVLFSVLPISCVTQAVPFY